MSALQLESRPRVAPLAWGLVGLAAAAAVGSTVSIKTTLAIGIALGIAATIRAFSRPTSILALLCISIFLELLTIGGLTITRALTPVALLVLVVQTAREKARVRVAAPLVWVGAYTVWAVASGLWTNSLAGTSFSVQSLAIALVYMFCFAALPREIEDVRRPLMVLAVTSLVVGGLSFLSFFGKIHVSLFLKEGRAQGGVGDPDFFSALELATLPAVLTLGSLARGAWRRVIVYGAVLVSIGSVLTSQSRGGAIGLVFLLVILIALPARTLFRTRKQKLLGLLCIFGAGTALIVHSPWAVLPRLQPIAGPSQNGSAAGSGRLEIWKAAEHTIRDHPLFGTGYGSFPHESNYLLLNTAGVDLTYYYLRPTGAEAHNVYLGTWAELGIVGLVLYVGMLVSTAITLRRTAVRAAKAGAHFLARLANGLFLGLCSWSITSFFLSTATARWFWIIVGLSLALPRLIPEPDYRSNAPAAGDVG